MDRIVLIATLFFGLLLAVNGSTSTPAVFARKHYNPTLGALIGALVGFGATFLTALALHFFSSNGAVTVFGGLVGGIVGLALLWNRLPDRADQPGALPDGASLKQNIVARRIRGRIMRALYLLAIVVALVSLATLIWTIVNKTVGLTAVEYEVKPEELTINGDPTGRALGDLSIEDMGGVLADGVRVKRLRVLVLQEVVEAKEETWASLSVQPISAVLKHRDYPAELADTAFNQIDEFQAADLLRRNLKRGELEDLIMTEIVQPRVVESWTLGESLTQRDQIEARVEKKYPDGWLEWRSWLNWNFISRPLDASRPDITGLRPALYGSLMVILITILVAFPVGVGAAIYLEEYARDNRLNRLIQTNINNLAGVPSIIYGMLGLAIFVRAMASLTSGNIVGSETANGRTILSAGFTLALLVLPIIIINAQEAIRAVPGSLRQASYGLGATQWQTIWHHVLPNAMPGILTGTILAISRAIGETAPLILIGASTYITRDPEGPFSNFTALPMLIYRWTTLPQAEFRNAAAAAIVVLLILLLTLNSAAVILRNRFSRSLS